MPLLLGIALGGAVGALLRYGLSSAVTHGAGLGGSGALPRYGLSSAVTHGAGLGGSGTLAVNVAGAFLLGLLIGVTEERVHLDHALRSALAVGVLGGFTTFSTYTWDVMEHLESGRLAVGVAMLAGTVALGLGAMALGLALGRGGASV